MIVTIQINELEMNLNLNEMIYRGVESRAPGVADQNAGPGQKM